MSLNYCELNPCHYYTVPGLYFNASLKMTKIKLELLCDPEQFLFVENSIRGGVLVIRHIHATANNEFLPNYNPDDPASWILFDDNNLYGHAMSHPLTTGNFKFLSPKEIKEFDIAKTAATEEVGFILEVDLKYPVHLHESQNDYPLATEKIKITQDILSSYSQSLINNLNDKIKYVLHSENLWLYLELGMKLVKIHKILQFSQSAWIKPYIYFKTTKRKEATSSFLQNLFKLFINSVFSECLQNRINLKPATNPTGERNLSRDLLFNDYISLPKI